MSASREEAAAASNQDRLWEVRKYCQVRPVYGRNDEIMSGTPVERPLTAETLPPPDAALSSLLQILMDRLDADVAMVSLLDEETQFFLAEAGREESRSVLESTKWFGCDQVSYHGGLCERTINIDSTQDPAIYEELDMTANPLTKDLPFVDGTRARFRSYAGAPVKTSAGNCIGTVFTMSNRPSPGLEPAQQQLLSDTAANVMLQLTLTLRALEGERLMQFQSATAALLRRQRPPPRQREASPPRSGHGVNKHPEYVVDVYQHAADVMRQSLELEGVLFQYVPSDNRAPQASWEMRQREDSALATSLGVKTSQPTCLNSVELDKFLKMFPLGGILQHLDGNWSMFTSEEGRHVLDSDIGVAVDKSFPGSQQLMVMPLFDVLHDRTAAICIGWLHDYSRVYSDRSDLAFMSAFCMSTISEVLRLETQMLERVKSDFLGSISHEMKTPLHQTLGNLELLLQTDCTDEQCDLAVNARFGATQLLEAIDKVLQYASISSEPEAISRDPSDLDVFQNVKKPPQIIGPRTEHIAGAASPVDLVRMCEEVVEDTTKRMRLLETIMSPSEKEEDGNCELARNERPGHPVQWPNDTEKDPFTIVVFDSSPIECVQLPRNTGFRIVLENLLSNAIKFTRAGCCARVSLKFGSSHVELVVSDCGYGMSEDFVRHNIYLPFKQQNPVSSGMGLGLSLVKRNIENLGGTVNIATDQASGTTATIVVQTKFLVNGIESRTGSESTHETLSGVIPPLPKRPRSDLPVMHACFYAPGSWLHRYDKRDERSIDLMFDSLSSTLREWYQPVLSLWQRQNKRTLPDLVFISQRNLAEFQEECGEEFANVKKVVICAAVGKNSAHDRERMRQASTAADALIVGAVLPSKLWEVVTQYFPYILQPGASASDQGHTNESIEAHYKSLAPEEANPAEAERDTDHDSTPKEAYREPEPRDEQSPPVDSDKQAHHDDDAWRAAEVVSDEDSMRDAEADVNAAMEDEAPGSRPARAFSAATAETSKSVLQRSMTFPIRQITVQPSLLLVDDNPVNLKMLGMFVNKCGVPAAKCTSVTGGQEAIDACQAFSSKDNHAKGFDIILMDLSMPEVSGFDATSSIRQLEKDSGTEHKTYIVALTGLVSDKDRIAAYEAGVDDYVTKPAGLQKVRNIIETWQRKRHDSGG